MWSVKGQQVVGKMVSKEVSICLICVRYEVGVWSVKSSLLFDVWLVLKNVFDQTISEQTETIPCTVSLLSWRLDIFSGIHFLA